MVTTFSRYFATWNKNIRIVQVIKLISVSERQTRFQLAITDPEKKINTDWVPYPEDTCQAWLALLLKEFPFIDEDKTNYPIVDLTYNKRMRTVLCSNLLLKDGSEYKRYVPMRETVALVRNEREFQGAIFLDDGKILKGKGLNQIAAILER